MASNTWRLAGLVLLALGAAVAALAVYADQRWEARTRRLRAGLHAARVPPEPARLDARELESLPAPVARYLRLALGDGQRLVSAARLRHTGTFASGDGPAAWRPFTSDQLVIARRPGFDWDARIAMAPGAAVRVHDAYVAGEGSLHAALFGLVPLADQRGTRELAEGELLRFLAESVWYPTVLLPGQGVRWRAVDDSSAAATLDDGGCAVTLVFRFGADGLVRTVRTESRGRLVGARVVPTPWQGSFGAYESCAGMRVPLEGEVAWVLPEGPRPYWRGRITALEYEFAP